MFISTAFAQAPSSAPAGSGFEAFLPLVLIFVVFYFLVFRPQQKKMKQQKEMLSALRRGDKVLTGGGIIATVIKVIDDNEVEVDLGNDTKVRVVRGTIVDVLSKPQPVTTTDKPAEGGKGK